MALASGAPARDQRRTNTVIITKGLTPGPVGRSVSVVGTVSNSHMYMSGQKSHLPSDFHITLSKYRGFQPPPQIASPGKLLKSPYALTPSSEILI